MCPLRTCSIIDILFYFSIFLILAEELMQDYFVAFHFRVGIKADQKEFPAGPDGINLGAGQGAKTQNAIYFCDQDGKRCFFRYKHIFYNPFFMPFHLKGEAVKADQTWWVIIRMNLGILLFLLFGLSRYVHPVAGLLGVVGGFLIIKHFGLPRMWEYWEQIRTTASEGEKELPPSEKDSL
jgi:hypothetical protein